MEEEPHGPPPVPPLPPRLHEEPASSHPPAPPLPPTASQQHAPTRHVWPAPRAAATHAPPAHAPEPSADKQILEHRLAELEKRLQQESEKVLRASLKSQEEAATSLKVEASLKDLQDKMRRDRRDAEQEEARRKLEAKVQELEARLAQERETWVATLKGQMATREAQDKELESHFASRLQELERRALEEKAGWQRAVLAKDEEIRNLRALAEKLKGADGELGRVSTEKRQAEARVAELLQERAETQGKLTNSLDKERELIQLRADVAAARQQQGAAQDRLREREERLSAELERQRAAHEDALRRVKAELQAEAAAVRTQSGAELAQYKEASERAAAELTRLRGACGALERQAAAARARLEDLKRSSADWERAQERYKAEFIVLQRRWAEREKEVRAEAASQALQLLEAEKAKLKLQAQDELNQRAARLADQLQKDHDAQVRRLEPTLRAEAERAAMEQVRAARDDAEKARLTMSAELERLHQERVLKDAEWSERLLGKERDLLEARARVEELSMRVPLEEQARRTLDAQKLELEKALQAAREDLGAARAAAAELKDRFDAQEKTLAALDEANEKLERLVTAQSAQVKSSQDQVERLKGELARQVHLARLAESERRDPKAPQ